MDLVGEGNLKGGAIRGDACKSRREGNEMCEREEVPFFFERKEGRGRFTLKSLREVKGRMEDFPSF